MTQQNSVACDHLMDYLAGELSDSDSLAFEDHAKHCSACQGELNVVLPVHQKLMEDEMDIPDTEWFQEHKERLLRPALSICTPETVAPTNVGFRRMRNILRRANQRVLRPSAIAVLILVLGVGFAIIHSGVTKSSSNPPMSFVQKVSLNPNKVYPNAHGVALVVNNHDQSNLILYVSNVPEQSQWGCYDVWGVQAGKRYSLGEFKVDTQGTGALSVQLPPERHYDSIEVTLEPYWGDHAPQGPQVLAGTWANV